MPLAHARARARPDVPRRIATISVHTSPLDQPGTGDAGGMNVFIVEVSKRLAARGVEVDIFTRATSSSLPPVVDLADGVRVRHITAGPFEGLSKHDLPTQLCPFAAGVLRAEAVREPGWYDLVHSHYWLSGQVAWLAKERWGVPMVHSSHTLAKVKNLALADGDAPEPTARAIGEAQVVATADRLLASTDEEARELVDLYDADPARVVTVAPGVDLQTFSAGAASFARARVGVAADAVLLLFVGRLQPLKAPDMLLRAAAEMIARDPSLRSRLVVAVVGGPSGSGLDEPEALAHLRDQLGLRSVVRFEPPAAQGVLADWYRAADVVVVPSYNESFGLVALEAQACGTPVVAASVGGLRTAVADGVSGLLVHGHEPERYADAIDRVVRSVDLRSRLSAGALAHAARFSWDATADGILDVYRDVLREESVLARVSAG
ncbi:MAG: D-inositol-3-phosphate glycosyltransferase [Frankiaceae bacterium]|nr:D-inositol-3-phosphate glycosyltransferase [Frankiaceae bacterium]